MLLNINIKLAHNILDLLHLSSSFQIFSICFLHFRFCSFVYFILGFVHSSASFQGFVHSAPISVTVAHRIFFVKNKILERRKLKQESKQPGVSSQRLGLWGESSDSHGPGVVLSWLSFVELQGSMGCYPLNSKILFVAIIIVSNN